jgi:hypothetical protein
MFVASFLISWLLFVDDMRERHTSSEEQCCAQSREDAGPRQTLTELRCCANPYALVGWS